MQISLPLTVLTYKVSLGGIEYLLSLWMIFSLIDMKFHRLSLDDSKLVHVPHAFVSMVFY